MPDIPADPSAPLAGLRPMKILLDNSSYGHLNGGDLAMLVASVGRLWQLFPNAEIRVLTRSPEILAERLPGVTPVLVSSVDANALRPGFRPSDPLSWFLRLVRKSQPTISIRLTSLADTVGGRFERLLLDRYPAAWIFLARLLTGRNAVCRRSLDAMLAEIQGADLVVGTGGGYVTDTFGSHAKSVCRGLLLASALGKPTGMVGQGLGPLDDPGLLSLLKKLFPRLSFLGLREGVFSPAIAKTLGADPNRVCVTGDDAIALAHSRTPAVAGADLGVNFRMSSYSGVSETRAGQLGSLIEEFARRRSIRLRPVIISRYPEEDDSKSLTRIIPSLIPTANDHASVSTQLDLTLTEVSHCKMVVTGSYHAAVFALSQGTPVVAVVVSRYYSQKFVGLFDRFRAKPRIISMDANGMEEQARSLLDDCWDHAGEERSQSLTMAREQISDSLGFYGRIPDMTGLTRASHRLV